MPDLNYGHRCVRWSFLFGFSVFLLMVTYGHSAMAQDPTVAIAVDPTLAHPDPLTTAIQYLGTPGVFAYLGLQLAKTVAGWNPTFRFEVVHRYPDGGGPSTVE